MPVGSGGFRASVVKIVEFRKEEYLDRHESHARTAAGKRPFLLLLSPDTLQLSTSGDAYDSQAVAASLLTLASIKKPEQRTLRGAGVAKPLALLHKLAHAGTGHGGSATGDASASEAASAGSATATEGKAAPPLPDGGESRMLLDGGGPLEEGQLLTFSIALSQVVAVEGDERRIKVLFGRQRPHRSTESTDDWKAIAKATVLPFALPYEGWKHKNWGVDAYLNRHRRDPFVSSVCFEADSPQEAAALRAAIEEAIGRLGQAVSWLSKDLPLHDRPVVTLVTATDTVPAGSCGTPGSSGNGGGRSGGASASAADLLAESVAAPEEQIICTFPRFRAPLEVPMPGPLAPASATSTATAAAAAAAVPAGQLAVHVWLHSPLGPAVATITEQQLRRSADAGGAPLSVVAQPREDQEAPAQLPASGGEKLEVVLQYSASRPLPRSPTRWRTLSFSRSGGTEDTAAAAAAAAAGGGGNGGLGNGGNGNGGGAAMMSLLAVPLLSAWLQLILNGSQAINVLQWVAFLVSSVAAIVGIVVLQLAHMRAPHAAAASQAAQVAPAQPWRLVLLSADLVSESRRRAGAPVVQRVVSSSTLSAAPSGVVLLSDVAAVELPAPIRHLVALHPAVLTDDIAARFVVGLGSNKAYMGLKQMVEWVESQGVVDLVRQPQEHFEAIRAHYTQVFYCRSTGSDCVLEIEHTGRWREAYDALRALGVSEAALLKHQFFCMEYAFRVLDPRPLPHGKTVKIIDLEGLSMRDVGSSAFKWYLQVGGALLAVNYPQRLHKAFLLNAPTWSGVIWKVLAAVIPRRTREQLVLFTRKQREAAAEALLQWVPAEQLPERYGGQCTVPLHESQLEKDMLAYVRRLNEGAARQAAQASAAEGSGQTRVEGGTGRPARGQSAPVGEKTP